jgi:hypothetical protein
MAVPAEWSTLLRRPEGHNPWDAWFDRLAHYLLNGCRLVANGQPYRLIEVEVYYHGTGHEDPFVHCDPLQLENGLWYFHRTRGTYREGSFKGLDLTFGDGEAFGGVLFRGLQTPCGSVVDGPSLLVDTLLQATNSPRIADLDNAIAGQSAWDVHNVLRLQSLPGSQSFRIFRTARVGLTLKRATPGDGRESYLLRRYRYLSEPRQTAKGKVLLTLALLQEGHDLDSIAELTGCPLAVLRRYQAEFTIGQAERDYTPYYGRDLTAAEWCRLHGLATTLS